MKTATQHPDLREIARRRLAELEQSKPAPTTDAISTATEQPAPQAHPRIASLDAARLQRCLLNNAARAGTTGVREPALVRIACDLVPGCSAATAREAIQALRRKGRLEYRRGDLVAIPTEAQR